MTDHQRRRLLRYGLTLGAASAFTVVSPLTLALNKEPARRLKLRNLHTGEYLNTLYWEQGEYLPEALQAINHLLRDHRSEHVTTMDVQLLDSLALMQRQLGEGREYQIISGYRSPQTNAMLRQQGHAVAKRSYHMLGQAIDIRLSGTPLRDLHQAALELQVGGVGYYPRDGFIHLDTGRVRRWQSA